MFLEQQKGKKEKNENGSAFSVDEEPPLLFVCLAVWLIGWLAGLVLEAGKTQGNTIFKNKKKQQQEILRTEEQKKDGGPEVCQNTLFTALGTDLSCFLKCSLHSPSPLHRDT